MANFYIHVPFCRKACHYCDFHFSTRLGYIDKMLQSMADEMSLRSDHWSDEMFHTLYLGGGTPSLLTLDQLTFLKENAYAHYRFSDTIEFTLEVNPEDVTLERIKHWKNLGINRLSLGLQSFEDRDLTLMNRSHTAADSLHSLELAVAHFDRVSVDIIYGIPGQSDSILEAGVRRVVAMGATHLSAYALTVEPNTALARFIEKELVADVDEEQAERQFLLLLDTLSDLGFDHYETSNFAISGHYSINNSAYWKGTPYLGIGPSAHSFKGCRRSWNVAQNHKYMRAIAEKKPIFGSEDLSVKDRYNEFVMTSLRTIWGVSYSELEQRFGVSYVHYFKMMSTPFIVDALLFEEDGVVRATRKGKFLIDGIASDLFMIEINPARK